MKIRLGLIQRKETRKHTGLDIGITNNTEQFKGMQIGAFNEAWEDSSGVQFGGINSCARGCIGMQIGLYNDAGNLKGIQVGFENITIYNNCGFQVGVYNAALEKLRGLQIGLLVNYCGHDSSGVQVAPINIRTSNPWYSKVVPILAVRTNKTKNLESKVKFA